MTGNDQAELTFGDFRLSRRESRLLRGGEPVALTPKALAVLYHLASRPDRLVTKVELLESVWPDVVVSDASVKVCIREIRRALEDDADAPRYIETVHRRGYRFVARVALREPVMLQIATPAPASQFPDSVVETDQPLERHRIVGRERELAQLGQVLDRARAGARQVIFITGSAGSGKTTLVEAFVRSARAIEGTTIAIGHCFEQFGAGEPYLPVWEAIGRLAREGGSTEAARMLSPTATVETPQLAVPPTPARENVGPIDRRLRQMADGLESLAGRDGLFVLVLEDLHWADYSTLDLISTIARRRGPGRLLVLGTYRPAEVMDGEHPLRKVSAELLSRRLAIELPMASLDEPAVEQYLLRRLGRSSLPAGLVARLYERTGGNPLFLVSLVDDLVEQGVLREGETADGTPPLKRRSDAQWMAALDQTIPHGVREMIEGQLDRVTAEEQRMLEAAAVAGVEFSAAAAAGALGEDVVAVESMCDDLARRHRFLESRPTAEWPDGTLAHRFGFLHELFHNVVYGRIPAARRTRLHQALGLRLEKAWGEAPAEEINAELAGHFEQARDWPRTVRYLRRAADAATRQYAHREAVDYLRRAHAALAHLSEAQRAEHELDLLMSLGINLQVTRGCAAPEVEEIHARAYELCRAAPDGSRPLFPILWGIWVFHKVRSNLSLARELADQLLSMAQSAGDDGWMLQGHQAMAVTALCSGDPRTTIAHMEMAQRIYDPARHAANARSFGQDPGVACIAFGAVAVWLCGDEARAVQASRRAVELAKASDQPTTLALALHFAAILHQLRGDRAETRRYAEASITLAAEEGFSFWYAGSTILRGWARSDEEDGIEEMRRGVSHWLATGSRTYHTYYQGLLADALLRHGRPEAALDVVNDAIVAAMTLEGLCEAELHRLRGWCILRMPSGDPAEPQRAFEKAVEIANRQGAVALERRAAASLQEMAATASRRKS